MAAQPLLELTVPTTRPGWSEQGPEPGAARRVRREAEAAGVREKCCLGTLSSLRALRTVYLQSVSRLLPLGSCGESPRHSGLKLRSF